jgi:hypothetical protein
MTNHNEVSVKAGKEFLDAFEALCKKHNVSISHEDGHGGFLLEPYRPSLVEWAKNADYGRYTTDDDHEGEP